MTVGRVEETLKTPAGFLRFFGFHRRPTFVADVESCVRVGLIGDELDPHSRALTDHTLKGDLTPTGRVKQNHRAGVQAAPQHQPAATRNARKIPLMAPDKLMSLRSVCQPRPDEDGEDVVKQRKS